MVLGLLHTCVLYFPLGVLNLEHLKLAFSSVLSLLAAYLLGQANSSGLQGPQWCGIDLIDNLFGVKPSATEHGLYTLSLTPLGLELMTHNWPCIVKLYYYC